MEYALTFLPYIAKGSLVTLSLFALTLFISIPLGIILALGNTSKLKPLRFMIQAYILIMRGTPLMLQVLFIYFGLPLFGIRLENFTSAVVAFALNYAAYFAEIFRGGINSVDNGQLEAARALGFSRIKTMQLIILPQAFINVIPSVSNETITLVKDTALVSVIALEDLLRAATLVVQRDLTILPFVVAALFYLVMTMVLTWVFNLTESKLNYKTR